MKNEKIVFYLVLVCLLFSLFAISTNLFVPYLWFDEAGQFFIAKGLNHYSAPFSVEGGLIDVIENNKHNNLDPGGFSILLHFWTYLSNYHVWLRILPFLFFLGVIASFIYLMYSWTKKRDLALLAGFIPILIPWIMSMGFEVRAYSMECLGTMLCIVALEQLKKQVNGKRLLVWSAILSLFMLSRYSEIIVVFVASLYVLYLIMTTHTTNKKKAAYVAIYSMPMLLTLSYIYFFALIYQNKSVGQVSYLPYLSNDISLLFQPLNLLFLGALGLLTWLYINKKRVAVVKKYEALLFVTLSVNLIFLVLSFMGKHPWTAKSTRCISLFLLVVLSYSALVAEYIGYLTQRRQRAKAFIVTFSAAFFLFALYLLYLAKEPLFERYTNSNNTYTSLLKIQLSNYDSIYVDYSETPCVRYMFEYGVFRKSTATAYPAPFTLAKKPYECMDMDKLLPFDAVITTTMNRDTISDGWELVAGTSDFYVNQLWFNTDSTLNLAGR